MDSSESDLSNSASEQLVIDSMECSEQWDVPTDVPLRVVYSRLNVLSPERWNLDITPVYLDVNKAPS